MHALFMCAGTLNDIQMSVTNFFYNKEYGHQWPTQNLFLDLHYDFITIKTQFFFKILISIK